MFYVLVYADHFSGICPLYLALLTAIIIARTISIVSRIVFAPGKENLRLVPLDNHISLLAHRSFVLFAWIVSIGLLCIDLFEHVGMEDDSKLLLRILWGSLFILTVALIIHFNRKAIGHWVKGSESPGTMHWFRKQMLSKWYFLAMGYVALLWMFWVLRLVMVGPKYGFTFGVSLFVVPVFLVLDSLLGWIFSSLSYPGDQKPNEPSEDEGTACGRNGIYLFSFTDTNCFGSRSWFMGKRGGFFECRQSKRYGNSNTSCRYISIVVGN